MAVEALVVVADAVAAAPSADEAEVAVVDSTEIKIWDPQNMSKV